MKNAFLIFILSAFTCFAAGNLPIRNGYLDGTPLNANGQAITNVSFITDTNGNPFAGGDGTGNVTGPGTSVANHLAVFADGSGILLADSGVPFANIVMQSAFQAMTNSLGSAAFRDTTAFDAANTAATMGANISNNILSIVPLAGITNSGLVDSNAFFKAMPYPHAYDRLWPVPPDIFNTYYAGPIRQSNHVIFLNQLATNGWLDMSRMFHVPSYYDLDEGWSSNRVNGVDVYSPSNFPNGITDLVAIAHSLGFKIGLYGIGSVQQGTGPTNIYGNATNLLAYGVDMMKLEAAANEHITLSYLYPFVRVFQTNGTPIFIEGAMDTTSRDAWLNGLMNSPRILVNGDVTSYANLLANLNYIWAHLMGGVGPGFFPSAEYANLNLTGDEMTTHFAAMAMIPAPWSISMPQTTLGNVAKFGLATNRDVYWVNKDPLVRPGFLLYSNQNVITFERSCVSNTAALAIRNDLSVSTNYTFYFTNLVQTPWFKTNSAYLARDLWNHTNSYQTNSLTISINAHATAMLRLYPVDWLAPWGNGINQTNLNASNLASGTVALARLGLSAPASGHTNILMFDSSGTYLGYDLAALLGLTGGGSGSVTSVNVAQQGFSSSGAVTTSGTVTLTRNADVDNLGYGQTNMGFLKVTNTASIGGRATISDIVTTNAITNLSLTASSLVKSDANKKEASIANGTGVLTNDGSGNFGWAALANATALKASQFVKTDANTNLVSTTDGYALTNVNIFDSNTNLFSGNYFWLGTNSFITTGSAVYFIALTNVPAVGTERWGQITIVATSDITVTNPIPGWKTSDMVSSRTVTNGNTAVIAVDVQAGIFTNLVINQFK